MTSPAAVTAILVLFDRTATPANVITFTSEITLMTGRTERCIPGCGPREGTADATAVAGATARVPSVITGVVPAGVVAEYIRRPCIGCMADVALHSRIYMA